MPAIVLRVTLRCVRILTTSAVDDALDDALDAAGLVSMDLVSECHIGVPSGVREFRLY
jgi:hypothetical protein